VEIDVPETIPRVRNIRYPGTVALFLIWTGVAALSYMRHYLVAVRSGVYRQVFPDCLHWLACFYPWVALTPVIFRLERRFPVEGERWRGNLVKLTVAGVFVAFASLVLSSVFNSAVGWVFPEPDFVPYTLDHISVWMMTLSFMVYACTVLCSFVIRRFMVAQEQEAKNAQLALEKSQLETSLKEAELEALRMRLNPHFLFNTLQNISVLTRQDPKTASQMLTRLGDLLRLALKRDPRYEITLEEEMRVTESYLAVEKMRFRDRLFVHFEIEGVERAFVPSLLLQPLVENAVNHGLNARSGGHITIHGSRQGDRLVLTVIDDGAGPPESDLEMGTGLGATSERLARLYPGRHELSMRRLGAGGTEVRVVLPFRASEAAVPPTQNERSPIADRR
jgi:two-component system LytT family sensor kinase